MDVVFRRYPEGDVIALFCASGPDCNAGNVMSYMHVGQHGEASRQLGRNLKLATAEEYAPLLRELQSIYKPEPIRPVTRLYAMPRKKKWDRYEYRIAGDYLSALINADYSGLNTEDFARFTAWREHAETVARNAGFTIGHWTCEDGEADNWGKCDVSELQAMRIGVTLHVYTGGNNA